MSLNVLHQSLLWWEAQPRYLHSLIVVCSDCWKLWVETRHAHRKWCVPEV